MYSRIVIFIAAVLAVSIVYIGMSFGSITKISEDNVILSNKFKLITRDHSSAGDAAISPNGQYLATSSRKSGAVDLWVFKIATDEWIQITDDAGDEIEPQWSPDNEHIAYVSTEEGNKDVWVISVLTKKKRRLTFSLHDDEYPSWSPDGKKIVYISGPWKKRHIQLLTISSEDEEITSPKLVNHEPAHVGACSFYPDGISLACHTYENGFGDIMHISLEGEVLEILTQGEYWDYKPSVSNNSKYVAFSRIVSNSSSIWIKKTGEIYPTQITSGVHQDRWPIFFEQKNKTNLFFHRLINNGSSIKVYNQKSKKVETLIEKEEHPLQAAFDSRAAKIAYCSIVDNKKIIRIYDRVNKSTKTVTGEFEQSCFPRWSPKDSRIAFLLYDEHTWQLATIELQSLQVTQLTHIEQFPNGISGPVDWSSDGAMITFNANTAPYESDIFTVNVNNEKIINITDDEWYDESPSFDKEGNILFMSTRGGGWTWGLFRIDPKSRSIVDTIDEPDYREKNFPREGPDQKVIWSEYFMCDGLEYIAEKEQGKKVLLKRNLPGARWASYSFDGSEILFTQVEKSVEYWQVNLD